MKYIIKFFPEIMIKSKSVRLRFTFILTKNVRYLLKSIDPSVSVIRHWDYIEVISNDTSSSKDISDCLINVPGIHSLLQVKERNFHTIQDISRYTLEINKDRLIGKSFCVRVKRHGKHNFTSLEVEKDVGYFLNENIKNTTVKLINPEETISIEIKNNRFFLIILSYTGLGGFPIGTQDSVLSLISGGFDSSVSSYMLMRRGCIVNYCFFNINNNCTYENNVRKIAYHLWNRFSRSHPVRFISINFSTVINEILNKVDDHYVGIILKRMMVRASSEIAKKYRIKAIVTGESIGQVSSQTITNLNVINDVTNILIFRPLISYDKEQIIVLSRKIGTESLTKNIPEYCGINSRNPTIRAKKHFIEYHEKNFNFEILNSSIKKAHIVDIKTTFYKLNSKKNENVQIITEVADKEIILDIRSNYEQKKNPLNLTGVIIQSIPFYELSNAFQNLDQSQSYALYCENGIMSQMQAIYLKNCGFLNVKVYKP